MQETAKKLLAGGFHIVPINAGSKGPRVKGWQDRRFDADDIKAGIGVKTGQGDHPVCAIDIDVLDPKLAQSFSDYCQAKFGLTVERVGQAPKTMLIYRASEAGWRKATSKWFEDAEGRRQRLEILGHGQQFVAYHTHPETGKPYQWIDMLGGLASSNVESLPVITADDVALIIEAFEDMATEHGLKADAGTKARTNIKGAKSNVDPFDFTAGLTAKIGITTDEARELLKNLDASDYDQWINIGMALHHEFDASDEAFEVWLEWSQTAENFASDEDVAKRWASFEAGVGGVTARTLIKLGNDANKKAKTANKQALLDGFIDDINSAKDIFTLTDEVLEAVGQQIDKNDIVIVNQVVKTAVDRAKSFGVDLSKTEVSKKLGFKEDKKTSADHSVDDTKSRTEIGNAKRMVLDNKNILMFEVKTEAWYQFDGNVWQKITQTDVEALAKETVENMANEFLEFGVMDKKEYFVYVQKSFTARNIMAMTRLVKSEDDVRVKIEDLDADKNLFTVANGMINLKTGKLVASDPKKRMTIASDVIFDPTASCPVFLETITDIFEGDTEMVEFMARWFGYQMLGNPKEDKIGIPYGCGANGKSTLFNTIRDVFGAHAKTADASTFLGNGSSSSGGPREDILRLQGARMVNVTEPSENSVLKESLIKAMTGGETMPARGAYGKHTVEVMPTWVTNMPTNHKPIIKGDDHGIWRRLMLIPFNRNFDKDPNVVKDIHRAEKLEKEHSGILNWLVAGCLEYQRIGLKPPKLVQQATLDYRGEMDLLADFIDSCCVTGPQEACTSAEIWQTWRRYAEERGELSYIPSARSLGRRLVGQGYKSIRSSHGIRGRGFLGLSIDHGIDGDIFEE